MSEKIVEELKEYDDEIAKLKARLAEKKLREQKQREIEELRRLLEEDEDVPAVPEPVKKNNKLTESSRLEEQNKMINDLQAKITGIDQSNEDLKKEIAALENRLKSSDVPSSGGNIISKTQLEIEELKRKLITPSDPAVPTPSVSHVEDNIKKMESQINKLTIEETESEINRKAQLKRLEEEKINLEKLSLSASNSSVTYGVEICFIMDLTGSMKPWIKIAKEKVRELQKEFVKINDKATYYCAFVGYRDFVDEVSEIVVQDFCEHPFTQIEEELIRQKAHGGGDVPEDFCGAFEAVGKLSWKSSTRLIIHIGDAPCHGTMYHNEVDEFPDGDPKGRIPEHFIRDFMLRKRIDYYFASISECTDKMLAKFSAVFENQKSKMEIIPIGGEVKLFLPSVVKSVTSSMQRNQLEVNKVHSSESFA